MSDAIITVENLGKKYRLQHQAERQRYTSLREVVANWCRGIFQTRNSKLETRNLQEDFWALKDVSFEVKQGEVVGIIGRNGAGKSTLLKILSRITEPTTGRVRLKGRVASLLEVGTGFHPELTGRENIFLNGAILGMHRAEIKRKFDEIVAFAEVEKFLDTPVKRYSSGMYVRLAFAVAAHLEPEILIVDEVLAVGDAQFQKKCMGKMSEVARGGRTILFVSHNMGAVGSLCSRGIVIHDGSVLVDASPDEAIQAHLRGGGRGQISDLAARQDRSGSGKIRFTGVKLIKSGVAVSSVGTGEPMEIELAFAAEENFRSEGLRFGISLVTAAGIEFVSFDSAAVGFNSATVPSRGVLRCQIPSLPVVGGVYSGWIYAGIHGVVADRVEDAFEIEVTSAQYPKIGFFALNHQWSISPA